MKTGLVREPSGRFDINLSFSRPIIGGMPIDSAELDRLQQAYKAAVDEWVGAIREEEALATPDYSLPAWERWDQAGFNSRNRMPKTRQR
jgi:hypothetical protein